MSEHTMLLIAGIGVLALLCQTLAWWLRLPAILFLLLAGMAAGPLLHWIDPAALFGDLLFPFVSLAVAVILFEGSLTLRFEEIRGTENVVRRMVTVGVLVTWGVTAVAAHTVVGFSWPMAFLFGAIMVVTGPTVIVPMLRTVRPKADIANILRWEGILIDPIGALLAVLVFEFIISGSGGTAIGNTLFVFGKTVATGLALGAAGGYFLGVILRRRLLPEYLHNIATLAILLGLYAISNLLAEESGLLTVTVMGIWLANMKNVPVDEILDFKETLSLLLISVLFILLAARIEFSQFEQLGWSAIWVFLVMQFVARPLKVLISTWGSTLDWRARALLAWIAPRGIVAAAVSALFALRLEQHGSAQAALLVPLTFLVIIGTVVLQSATARPLARLLGVAEPEPRGYLIVGVNQVARAIAQGLKEAGLRVLLIGTNWNNIRAARMDNLETFYGNPVSEYADRHLDLVGIGGLLALSSRDEINALAALRYRPEFGPAHIFGLAPYASGAKSGAEGKHTVGRFSRTLFSTDMDYTRLSALIAGGAVIRRTPLTEKFGYTALHEQYGGNFLPLFALDARENIHLFTTDDEVKPSAGWTIFSLAQPDATAQEKSADGDSEKRPQGIE
ncbi:MAG: sodium:proton antiporter [Gammaproteobacteria bacterium]|nr:sodium:proton antiporter [Gammaproteobacteria bacterium]